MGKASPGEGPFLCPMKSGPPRPGLPLTFDRGQVGPEILLQPGALILQRERQGQGEGLGAHPIPEPLLPALPH